jgi:hypothetical protein
MDDETVIDVERGCYTTINIFSIITEHNGKLAFEWVSEWVSKWVCVWAIVA